MRSRVQARISYAVRLPRCIYAQFMHTQKIIAVPHQPTDNTETAVQNQTRRVRACARAWGKTKPKTIANQLELNGVRADGAVARRWISLGRNIRGGARHRLVFVWQHAEWLTHSARCESGNVGKAENSEEATWSRRPASQNVFPRVALPVQTPCFGHHFSFFDESRYIPRCIACSYSAKCVRATRCGRRERISATIWWRRALLQQSVASSTESGLRY